MGENDGVLRNTDLGSNGNAGRGVRLETVDRHAIGDDLRPTWPVAASQMRLETGGRIGDDHIRQPRQGDAGLYDQPQSDAVTTEIHIGTANAPNETSLPAAPRHPKRDKRDQITVIHPA